MLRNQITDLVRASRKDFYKNYFHKNNQNLCKVWQGIKEVINIKTKSCITVNDILISDPTKISNAFNTYYSYVAEGILQKRKYEGDGNFKKFLPPEQNIELIISHIEPIQIKNIIKEFNHNKATGPCSIPANVLSLICDSISPPLSTIANICFKTGVHPDKLKVA